MRRFRHLVAAVVSLLSLAGADIPPPAIVPDGIVNAASRLPASLRGGAIAPGMRFIIPGARLGPETTVRGSESDPPVRLAEVSVRIKQGDRAVDAGLLLVSATTIEAWMPQAAPLGDVELTVTYQEHVSEPYHFTLVAANAGFYSPADAPSAVPDAKRGVETVRGGAVALWGTGLAGIADVFVGGKRAEDVHIGAANCCKGVEKIAFRVPDGTPLGCFVPVQALTADHRPSNAIPIAVHPPGEPCRDELDWFREGIEQARRAGFVALARISIDVAPAREVAPKSRLAIPIRLWHRQLRAAGIGAAPVSPAAAPGHLHGIDCAGESSTVDGTIAQPGRMDLYAGPDTRQPAAGCRRSDFAQWSEWLAPAPPRPAPAGLL